MNHKIKSMMMVVMMILSTLIMATLIVPDNSKATITGTYPPLSGDWTITEDTYVEGESISLNNGAIIIYLSNGVKNFVIKNSTITFSYTSILPIYAINAVADVDNLGLNITFYNTTFIVDTTLGKPSFLFMVNYGHAYLNISIINCQFSGIQDMYFRTVSNLIFKNNTITGARYGIRLEQNRINPYYLTSCIIDNNTLINSGLRIWNSYYMSTLGRPYVINITNTSIQGSVYVMGAIINMINTTMDTGLIYIRVYTDGYIYVINPVRFVIEPEGKEKVIEFYDDHTNQSYLFNTTERDFKVNILYFSAEYGRYTVYYYNITLNGYLMEYKYEFSFQKTLITFYYNIDNISVNPKIYPLTSPFAPRIINRTTLLIPIYNTGSAYTTVNLMVKRNGEIILNDNYLVAPYHPTNVYVSLASWWSDYRHNIEIILDPYDNITEISESDNHLLPSTFYTSNISGSHKFGIRIDDWGVSVAVHSIYSYYESQLSVNSYKYFYDVLEKHDAFATVFVIYAHKDPMTLEVRNMTTILNKTILYYWRNHTDRIIPQAHGWTHTLPSKYGDTGIAWQREFANVVLHTPINYTVAYDRIRNISIEYHRAFPNMKYNITNMLLPGLYATYPDTFYALIDNGYKYVYLSYYDYDGSYNSIDDNKPFLGKLWWWSSVGMMDIYAYANPNPNNDTIFRDYIYNNLGLFINQVNRGQSPAIYCHAGALYVDNNGNWLQGYNGSRFLDVALTTIKKIYPDAEFIPTSMQAQMVAQGYTYSRALYDDSINGEVIRIYSNINTPNAVIPLPDWWINTSNIYAYDFSDHKFTTEFTITSDHNLTLPLHEGQAVYLFYSAEKPHIKYQFKKGWNTVNLPYNMTIGELMRIRNMTSITLRLYNATTNSWEYRTIIRGFNDDNHILNITIPSGLAFYLYVNNTIEFNVSLIDKSLKFNYTYSFHKGWNFIGLPPFNRITLSNLLKLLPSEVSSIVIRVNGQYITLIRNFTWQNTTIDPDTYILTEQIGIYVYVEDNLTASISVPDIGAMPIRSISIRYRLYAHKYLEDLIHRELTKIDTTNFNDTNHNWWHNAYLPT